MKPLPWSWSALTTHKNCGWQYHERYVSKRVKNTETEEQDWGKIAHSAFEARLDAKTPLPPSLMEHEGYVQKIEKHGGILFTEMQGCLDRNLTPISDWWSDQVWVRVVLDVLSVIRNGENALVVDWKTGKQKDDMEGQLALFAIYVFCLFPKVNICDTRFYFTQTATEVRKVYGRDEQPRLWDMLLPALGQYRESFKTDTWQKRQSGLCNGYCPVTDCEFWKPKRTWRR